MVRASTAPTTPISSLARINPHMIVWITEELFLNKRSSGCRPWIMSAPTMIVAETPPGTPSTKSGMSEVPVTPLLEPSVAASPLSSSLPN